MVLFYEALVSPLVVFRPLMVGIRLERIPALSDIIILLFIASMAVFICNMALSVDLMSLRYGCLPKVSIMVLIFVNAV